MKNEYNKCPFCDTLAMLLSGGYRIDEYIKIWECPKCGANFASIYRLEYHGREIIIPPHEGGETDDN